MHGEVDVGTDSGRSESIEKALVDAVRLIARYPERDPLRTFDQIFKQPGETKIAVPVVRKVDAREYDFGFSFRLERSRSGKDDFFGERDRRSPREAHPAIRTTIVAAIFYFNGRAGVKRENVGFVGEFIRADREGSLPFEESVEHVAVPLPIILKPRAEFQQGGFLLAGEDDYSWMQGRDGGRIHLRVTASGEHYAVRIVGQSFSYGAAGFLFGFSRDRAGVYDAEVSRFTERAHFHTGFSQGVRGRLGFKLIQFTAERHERYGEGHHQRVRSRIRFLPSFASVKEGLSDRAFSYEDKARR